MKSAGNGQLPSYAQPTIAFSQYAKNQANKSLALKAGVSKSRPSSVATFKANDSYYKSPGSKSKKEPGFLNLFKVSPTSKQKVGRAVSSSSPKPSPMKTSTPVKDYSGIYQGDKENLNFGRLNNKRSSSSSYRSPSLAQKVINFAGSCYKGSATASSPENDLESVMKETEQLISKVGLVSDDIFVYSSEQLKAVVNGKGHLPIEDWYSFVDYHCLLYQQLQDKINLDHKLIQNVLELNNFISGTIRDQDEKLKSAKEEILRLHVLLESGMTDFSTKPKFDNEQADPKSSLAFSDSGESVPLLYLDRPSAVSLAETVNTPLSVLTNELDVCVTSVKEFDISSGSVETRLNNMLIDDTPASNSNPYIQIQNYIRNPFSPFGVSIPTVTRAKHVYDDIYQQLTQPE